MRILGIGKNELFALLIALIVLLGLYKYFGSVNATAIGATILAGIVLSFYFVLEKTYLFYLLLVCLIPLSVDIGIVGEAQVNSPSEVMILPLLAVLMLFHRDYGKTLKQTITHPISILLAMDIFWQLIVTLTSSHMDISFKRWVIHTIFIVGFFTTITILKDPKRLLKVWMAYVVGLVPVMLITFDNFRIQEFNPRTVFSISKPFFPDHTVYGACLAFIIPLLILCCMHWRKLNWKSWQLVGLFVVSLVAIGSEFIALSRAAILSLAIALVFGLFLHWKMRFKTLLLGLVGIGILVFAVQGQIYEYFEETDAVSNDGKVSNHSICFFKEML